MPLEGHWERQHAPLVPRAGRERRGLVALAGVLAATVAAIAILASAHGSPARHPGCIDLTVASTTGGAAIHACGERAARLCSTDATGSRPITRPMRKSCRAAGLAP